MSPGIYILLASLLFLLILLLTRLRVSLIYEGEVRVFLKIWFIRVALYPKKEKVHIRDFSYKRLKKKKKKPTEVIKQEPPERKQKPSFSEQLALFSDLFSALYGRFLRYFRLDVHRLRITVATGDAAQTAILYGVTSQSLAYLLAFLDRHTNLHPSCRADIGVYADFIGQKSSTDCDLTFSLRVYQLIHLGVKFAWVFLSKKSKAK
ncbi:MAG: DUF2953 domain-containing protein [Clostridia bacterium]|nr:DUF2953 domain-containing protein [Clostridia bacterium]